MVSIPRKIARLVAFALIVSSILLVGVNTGGWNLRAGTKSRVSGDRRLVFSHKSSKSPQQIVEENYKTLQEILKKPIHEPKTGNLVRPPSDPNRYDRANATMLVLVRNRELGPVVRTIKQIEAKFNQKFHYPYVFLNEEPFTERFKETIQKHVSGEAFFESIDKAIWEQPKSINLRKQADAMQQLETENVGYAKLVSYHNMCRYYSVNFYNHPRLQQFRYYWRFEPGTDYYCDLDYDVFKFMQMNEKTYGFVIALYDVEQSVKTLWPRTLEFLAQHPDYLHPNGAYDFLLENLQNPHKTLTANGYSTCHFWSNFEIADMDFYRSKPYSDWVNFLDSTGGFYYERWGDAPVHSVGVSLFEDRDKIHWFRDIGYKHQPYTLCSNRPSCAGCKKADFTYKHLRDQNCLTNWWNYEMSEDQKNIY
ncbi:hypothetical protein KL905_002883 [Ogataea polymorpha]|uniref:Uncharacterized protein n=1 Tax=Ogataea polymorpha TaxID=460523 RepID=A0A1B7SQI0_9ASCO|nr:uncharacterized protein OGAPODRAFT_97171 [Ogataea polymorpha]KAG7900741.1 hypothetical protein KL935_002674 [Ogataea polymorpha]KAG7921425.1 hypothetical protein KL905_002883 [Ogataea polymorpha]KAG7934013.1 hypothetical protein KL934_002935 [Ogataea polymorpha]KAH3658813.1 hypothetical protein OGATHE_006539 [Ogataea polymorpha]OBA18743.1 hypothetical protein OGAPODRAFT_97171 [Ogataea polymorpha]